MWAEQQFKLSEFNEQQKNPITFPSYEYRPYAIITRGFYIRNPQRTKIYSRFFFLEIQDFCIDKELFVIKSG